MQQGIYKVINPVVRFLIKLGLTPNAVTTIGLLLNIGVAAIFVTGGLIGVRGDLSYVGMAGGLILFAGMFDMLDGQVARLGGMTSTFGAMYDSVLDRYSELIMFLGICYYLVAHHYLISSMSAFIALIGSMMVSYTRARAEGLGIDCKGGLMQRPERVVMVAISAIACSIAGIMLGGNYKLFFPENIVSFHGNAFEAFEPITIFTVPLAVMAVLTNVTAFRRLRESKKALDAKDQLAAVTKAAKAAPVKEAVMALLMFAAGIAAPLSAAAKAPGYINEVDTFPVPRNIPGMMFYVQRTPNVNTIIYALNYTSPGVVSDADPFHIFWIRYQEGGIRKELNYIQRHFAYGLKIDKLAPNSWKLRFVSYQKRPLYLQRAANGQYYVFADINNHRSVLQRLYIRIDPGGTFWKPNAKYIELKGSDVQTGQENIERIKL